jgi:Ca-activated chloride channel family protein
MSTKWKWVAGVFVLIAARLAFAQNVQVTFREARFTVTGASGQFVKGLTRSDFIVYEDDVRKEVTDFVTKLQSPISVALLVDRSQSMGDRFNLISNAAVTFVKSMIRENDDRGLVVAFDSKVYLLQDWTASIGDLADNIHKLTPAGGTALFDALYKTCRDKFDPSDTRQKVAVLITDGEDTASRATLDQALQMARLSGVAIYVIGVQPEGSLNTREMQGRRVLTDLSEATGGRVFYPEENREDLLSGLFSKLQDELRNEYSIGYYVDKPLDNSFHRVRIEAKDKSLTVHAPKGYYARKL